MGGMIAQEIAQMEPQLVRKMIITVTGPAGGVGISKVARVTYLDNSPGLALPPRPQNSFLFFTRELPAGIRAGKRIPGAIEGALREPGTRKSPYVALQAQLKALRSLGLKAPSRPFKGPSARACRQWR